MIHYNNKSKTLCLGMIVRDEEQDIVRCLDSVVDYIDYWVICDTGSKDQTKEIIAEYFQNKGVPGELHEDEWVDFSHNRNKYIERAAGKADDLLLMDADDYLIVKTRHPFKEAIEEDTSFFMCRFNSGN